MNSSFKFINKLWNLHQKIILKKNDNNIESETNLLISKFTNKMIDKITKGLERFHYNGIIANLYETYNFFNKEIEKPLEGKSLIKNYNKILYLLMPIIPHFSSECLQNIGNNEKLSWPKTNEDLLSEENLEIVIQINGKKKTTINCIENISEEQLINKITELNIKKNIFQGKEIKRSIFVKNRLINLILK